jgi:hypothetical protein
MATPAAMNFTKDKPITQHHVFHDTEVRAVMHWMAEQRHLNI